MEEHWKEIDEFPGYEVSDLGRIRSYYKKEKKKGSWGGYERVLYDEPQRILKQSDDGNGYLKVYLQDGDKRRCVKVHRLVAEAFVDNPNGYDTVDHIKSGPEGKLDNSASNLRWLSRRENIQKAYNDGVCEERIRRSKRPIVVTDEWFDEELYFNSVCEAASSLRVNQTTLSHALSKYTTFAGRYHAEYANEEDRLLYGRDVDDEYYYQ